MSNDEIAGYLIRRELDNGEDEFWNASEEWISDPGDAELYEEEAEAEAVAEELRAQGAFEIFVEEVFYDDEDEDEDSDDEDSDEEDED